MAISIFGDFGQVVTLESSWKCLVLSTSELLKPTRGIPSISQALSCFPGHKGQPGRAGASSASFSGEDLHCTMDCTIFCPDLAAFQLSGDHALLYVGWDVFCTSLGWKLSMDLG